MGVLAATGHKPHHYPLSSYTLHLPEKAERARVIAFSSPHAETRIKDTGNSKIPKPGPSFHFLFLSYSHLPHRSPPPPSYLHFLSLRSEHVEMCGVRR